VDTERAPAANTADAAAATAAAATPATPPDAGAAAASGGEEPPPAPSPGARSGKQRRTGDGGAGKTAKSTG